MTAKIVGDCCWHDMPSREAGKTAGVFVKLYDYEYDGCGIPQADVPRSQRRKVPPKDLLDKLGFRGVQIERVGDNLALLRYDGFKGTHYPTNLEEFVSVFEKLSILHQAGVVHCDIRQTNLVFSGQEDAWIIDLDFARKVDEAYPGNFNWPSGTPTPTHLGVLSTCTTCTLFCISSSSI
eukprot:m.4860 g.4860  ORF g.4860 m.4860 type:complete len:179 (-) comp2139_c0_seq1:276-812(-)